MSQEFYSQDIKLVLEAITKHFLQHSEYLFQEFDLEARAYIRKALKKPTVLINREPYWVLQNWHDIMTFMMCGQNLDKEVHTTEDLSDLVQQRIGSNWQTARNKRKGSGRAHKT